MNLKDNKDYKILIVHQNIKKKEILITIKIKIIIKLNNIISINNSINNLFKYLLN